jgi:Domain of unknown function (DUF4936)
MRTLFIYYRFHVFQTAGANSLQEQVLAMQGDLQSRYQGLQARLFQRLDETPDWQTWMETYEIIDNAQGVNPALEQAIHITARALFDSWPAVQRHTEVFLSCP